MMKTITEVTLLYVFYNVAVPIIFFCITHIQEKRSVENATTKKSYIRTYGA